jgi:anti-sigma factor RsiW
VTCREFADFMADYLSGELPADTRARFDHHVSLCVNCRRYLAGYETTVALGKRAFEDDDAPVPADVPEELVRSILAARKSA